MVRAHGLTVEQARHCPKYLFRLDVGDAGEILSTFLRVVVNRATRAGNPATDDKSLVFVPPFVPVVASEVNADDIGAAKRRKVLRPRIIPHEHLAKREQCIEIIERQSLVDELEPLRIQQCGVEFRSF